MSDFKSYFTERVEEIEQMLDEALPAAALYPQVLHEAMRYSVLGGGKRLRALLIMGACQATGGAPKTTAGLVTAMEMIHAYSLIHDDLPCMDDDDLRRGKPSNHRVYGEAMAVLAGDALLTEAFAELARMPEKYGISCETTLAVIAEVAAGAGSTGMVGGQAVDIQAEQEGLSAVTLDYIHRHKTGALFKAALRGGALLGGADAAQLAQITSYGESFGLAFQIVDDILDLTGKEGLLGKAIGADSRLGKLTYPSLYGLEKSKELARAQVERCLQALEAFSKEAWPLRQLARFIVDRDY